jgi:hypothetical protein
MTANSQRGSLIPVKDYRRETAPWKTDNFGDAPVYL